MKNRKKSMFDKLESSRFDNLSMINGGANGDPATNDKRRSYVAQNGDLHSCEDNDRGDLECEVVIWGN